MKSKKKSANITTYPQEELNRNVFQKALQLLAKRAYTTRQLRLKLLRWYPVASVDAVIKRFQELHLLDEKEFAHSFIRHQLRLGHKGLLWIRAELLRKGVPSSLLHQILPLYEEEEEQSARRVVEKLKKRGRSSQVYVSAYLKQKGFSPKTIHSILQGGEE
ncbi:MAG: regulatory protein RecX [bacterium JZ-2024 1]